jgi:hypothetical protein
MSRSDGGAVADHLPGERAHPLQARHHVPPQGRAGRNAMDEDDRSAFSRLLPADLDSVYLERSRFHPVLPSLPCGTAFVEPGSGRAEATELSPPVIQPNIVDRGPVRAAVVRVRNRTPPAQPRTPSVQLTFLVPLVVAVASREPLTVAGLHATTLAWWRRAANMQLPGRLGGAAPSRCGSLFKVQPDEEERQLGGGFRGERGDPLHDGRRVTVQLGHCGR